jgi:hypothetical protein
VGRFSFESEPSFNGSQDRLGLSTQPVDIFQGLDARPTFPTKKPPRPRGKLVQNENGELVRRLAEVKKGRVSIDGVRGSVRTPLAGPQILGDVNRNRVTKRG